MAGGGVVEFAEEDAGAAVVVDMAAADEVVGVAVAAVQGIAAVAGELGVLDDPLGGADAVEKALVAVVLRQAVADAPAGGAGAGVEAVAAAANADLLESEVVVLLPGGAVAVVVVEGQVAEGEVLAAQDEDGPAAAAVDGGVLRGVALQAQGLDGGVLHVVAADQRVDAYHDGVAVAAVVVLERLIDPKAVAVAVGEGGDGADEAAGGAVVDIHAHAGAELVGMAQGDVAVAKGDVGGEGRGDGGDLEQDSVLARADDGHVGAQVQGVVHQVRAGLHPDGAAADAGDVVHGGLQGNVVLAAEAGAGRGADGDREWVRVAFGPASHAHGEAPWGIDN